MFKYAQLERAGRTPMHQNVDDVDDDGKDDVKTATTDYCR